MGIVLTRVAKVVGVAGQNSTTIPSWTPGAWGGTNWVLIASGSGATSPAPTGAGNTGTWDQINTVLNDVSKGRLTAFGCVDATTTGTTVVSWGVAQEQMAVWLFELSGADPAALIVQSVSKATIVNGTSLSQTLATFGDTTLNLGLVAVQIRSTSAPAFQTLAGWHWEGGDFLLGGANPQGSNIGLTMPGTTTPAQEETAGVTWTPTASGILLAMEIKALTTPAAQSYRYVQGAQFRLMTIEVPPEILVGRTVTWDSTDTGVATVTTPGESTTVTLVGAGTANIQAHCEGVDSNLVAVSVSTTPGVLASIEVTPGSLVGTQYQSGLLTAILKDAGGNTISPTGYTIGWATTDAAVAGTAPGHGQDNPVTVFFNGPGECQYQAWVGSIGSNVVPITVTSAATTVAYLTLVPTHVEVNRNTPTLTAHAWTALGEEVPNQTFTWVSNNPAIATVPETGNPVGVTGVAIGECTVTATLVLT